MHPLAARTVRQALAAGACIDPVEHFDDLHALEQAAADEQAVARRDILDVPVIVGRIDSRSGRAAYLWSPSYAAMEWIDNQARLWFEEPFLSLAICWALAYARDPEALRAAADPRAARRAVHLWAGDLAAPLKDLFDAASAMLAAIHTPGPAEPIAGGRRCPIGRILGRLVQEFGQPEDYWLFGPIRRMDDALDLLRRQDEAASRAASGRGAAAADPDSPDVQAFVRWRRAADAFLKKFVPAAPAVVPHG